ncbi:MAG TPA: hypothetical protein PLZ55_17435, partial [bacterium]|nr:hypothetical protein [bacterium]
MQPALRNLLIEAAIVLVVLGFLLWISIPRFLAAQSINTPDNFPDPNFRKVIEKFMGVEPEGIFSARKAAAKTERLLCIGCFVGSTKGIEFFPNITRFDCSGNPLNENPDISRNTALTDFRCRSSQVTALDFSKNTALQIVDCFDNKITNLDISRNPALAELECSHNQIVKLDLSKNVNLNDLRCSENLLETLDVSACKNLEKFSCGYNRLQKLDVSQNPSLRM